MAPSSDSASHILLAIWFLLSAAPMSGSSYREIVARTSRCKALPV